LSFVDEYRKIDSDSATGAGLFFFSLLAPGVLAIFLFERELFINLGTAKLVLLCLSFSSPGVVIPIFISTMAGYVVTKMHGIEKTLLGSPKEWFYRHAINNAISLYLLLFLSYIFSWRLSSFLWCFVSTIIGMCAWEMFYMIKRAVEPSKYPPMDVS
jgi:hypothetical protein